MSDRSVYYVSWYIICFITQEVVSPTKALSFSLLYLKCLEQLLLHSRCSTGVYWLNESVSVLPSYLPMFSFWNFFYSFIHMRIHCLECKSVLAVALNMHISLNFSTGICGPYNVDQFYHHRFISCYCFTKLKTPSTFSHTLLSSQWTLFPISQLSIEYLKGSKLLFASFF
jgi:hypothetical protein